MCFSIAFPIFVCTLELQLQYGGSGLPHVCYWHQYCRGELAAFVPVALLPSQLHQMVRGYCQYLFGRLRSQALWAGGKDKGLKATSSHQAVCANSKDLLPNRSQAGVVISKDEAFKCPVP